MDNVHTYVDLRVNVNLNFLKMFIARKIKFACE